MEGDGSTSSHSDLALKFRRGIPSSSWMISCGISDLGNVDIVAEQLDLVGRVFALVVFSA